MLKASWAYQERMCGTVGWVSMNVQRVVSQCCCRSGGEEEAGFWEEWLGLRGLLRWVWWVVRELLELSSESPESDMLCRRLRDSLRWISRLRRFCTPPSIPLVWSARAISPRPGLANLCLALVSCVVIQLLLFCGLGRSGAAAPGCVGIDAASCDLINALRRLVVSGVASLSLFCSGDLGVSPADESSMSLFVRRGVLYSELKTGRGGRGLEGEGRWLAEDFGGES